MSENDLDFDFPISDEFLHDIPFEDSEMASDESDDELDPKLVAFYTSVL